MEEFVKTLLQNVPLPLVLGISGLVLVLWILKQYRSYDSNAPLFKDKIAYILFCTCIAAVIGWYVFQEYKSTKPIYRFSSSEIGIYLCSLDHDTNREFHTSLEPLLLSHLRDDFPNLRVVASKLEPPHDEDKLSKLGIASKAALVISGRYGPGDRIWIMVTNLVRNRSYWIKETITTKNLVPLVSEVRKELEGLSTRDVRKEEIATQTDISQLVDAITSLQAQLGQLEKRIASVEVEKIGQAKAMAADYKTPEEFSDRSWAVLIGVGEYQNPDLPDLRYPKSDVEALKTLLLKQGYRDDHISVLLDEKATKKGIEERIIDYLRRVTSSEDRVLIYYGGHAITQTGSSGLKLGILCPVDFAFSQAFSSGISMSQVKEWFDLIPAHQVALLVDSCFAGLVGIATRGLRPTFEISQLLEVPSPIIVDSSTDLNRVIVVAGTENQPVMEGSQWGHGLFTYHLLGGLRGGADLDRNGLVDSAELFHYLYPKVYIDSGGRQTPQVFGWGNTSIPLAFIEKTKPAKTTNQFR